MQSESKISKTTKEKHLRQMITYGFLISVLVGFLSYFLPDGGVRRMM